MDDGWTRNGIVALSWSIQRVPPHIRHSGLRWREEVIPRFTVGLEVTWRLLIARQMSRFSSYIIQMWTGIGGLGRFHCSCKAFVFVGVTNPCDAGNRRILRQGLMIMVVGMEVVLRRVTSVGFWTCLALLRAGQ